MRRDLTACSTHGPCDPGIKAFWLAPKPQRIDYRQEAYVFKSLNNIRFVFFSHYQVLFRDFVLLNTAIIS